MFRSTRWILAALLTATAIQAQSPWIHVRSKNFQVYSQATEQQTRTTLNYFERVHDFFVQMTGNEPSNSLPVYVVIFGSLKEFEPYRVKEFSSAYYHGGQDRDYIVIGEPGADTAHTAAHEYAHLAVHHTGARYPPWLDEGLADMYSNLNAVGDEVEFGSPIAEKVRALARERWVPLATILSAGFDSPYYNETRKAGSLYDEGWALVQFLETSDQYRPGFERLLRAIGGGTPSVEAIETVYGRSLSRIEEELKVHLSGGANRTISGKMKLDAAKDGIVSVPANMYDVRLALASLTRETSGVDAKVGLETLARQDPSRPEPLVQLGYRAWNDRDTKLAIEYFAKAYALGDRNPDFLWDYGRLAHGANPPDAVRVLGELLKLEPDNLNARIELASAQASARQPREALATVSTIKTIDAEHGQSLFYTMARAQVQLGQSGEARASAVRLQSVALSKEYRDFAAEILNYLDQQDRQGQARTGRAPAAPKPATAKPAALAEVQGRIVVMECGSVPNVVIETSQGRKTYVLEPNRYAITGNLPPGQGLRCGPQDAPPLVRIRYDVLPADARGDGVVRELHFQ